jgi:hypothetical protein
MADYSTKISRTGRVQNWLDDPQSRLPVSCTVFVVEDSMEGPDGIEASWRFVSHALRNGAGVAVHLSKLRPCGSDNGRGLVSSGPVSFARIYSALNETLRRGGVYKNGAVVCHLDIDHPDILEFVNADRGELAWVKRCVDLTPELWQAAQQDVKDSILRGIARGDIWLNKIKYQDGERIYGNVCLEVYLPHRGTCLLQHVNLGACESGDLPGAFRYGMKELVKLHRKTGVGETGEYLSPAEDRQVGLGILGLANFLKQEGITYKEFGDALERFNNFNDEYVYETRTVADSVVADLVSGLNRASEVARAAGMVRAFAIAPTASCSYRSRDLAGYTSTPEIAPPISREVDRDSGTFGVQTYSYGDVEIASEVGWDDYYRVVNGFVRLFQETGLFHGYSFNSWSDVVTYDEEFIEGWLQSPQTSLYYSLQVMDDTQDKSSAMAALGSDADALLADLFAPLSEEEEAAGQAFKSEPVQPLDIRCIGCEE